MSTLNFNVSLSIGHYPEGARMESLPSSALPLGVPIGEQLPLDVAQEIMRRWNNYPRLEDYVRNAAVHHPGDYGNWARAIRVMTGL